MGGWEALKTRQLSTRLSQLVPLASVQVPRAGWIRTIRQALGLTAQDLSERIGVTRPAITHLEKAEQEGRITLNKLREVARALDCTLLYALVPNESIETVLDRRARIIAEKRMGRVWHSMLLEGQEISEEEKERQITDLVSELRSRSPRDLWRDE
ncbi:MAG: mobile mystery protein A [Gemmatimonadota bacterium]